MHHIHGRHAKLLTTAIHIANRHHRVHVARLVRNHRNFGLCLRSKHISIVITHTHSGQIISH